MYFKIPLLAQPQRFRITLGTVDYVFRLTYQNTDQGGWVLDIADTDDAPIVSGIPLVTGINLLGQYPHLGFAGRLWLQTLDDNAPTYDNLGSEAFLYWVTG